MMTNEGRQYHCIATDPVFWEHCINSGTCVSDFHFPLEVRHLAEDAEARQIVSVGVGESKHQ